MSLKELIKFVEDNKDLNIHLAMKKVVEAVNNGTIELNKSYYKDFEDWQKLKKLFGVK